MKYLILILMLLIPTTTNAKSYFNVGTSLLYINIDSPKYEFVNQSEQLENPIQNISSLSLGVGKEFKNRVSIYISTNRLLKNNISRTIRYRATGQKFKLKTKIRNDTLQIGKRIYKIYTPAIWVASIKKTEKLYSGNEKIVRDKTSFVYGFNINILLNKNWSIVPIFIFPNKEFNLRYGFGLGIFYNF